MPGNRGSVAVFDRERQAARVRMPEGVEFAIIEPIFRVVALIL